MNFVDIYDAYFEHLLCETLTVTLFNLCLLQIVQLQELLDVRHSVFVLGFAGVGKSKVWGTLNRTYKNQGKKPSAIDLDPKAVTNNELFGIINPSTREWKDGKSVK